MTSLPEFKALNPNGLVPVIEDENGVLWESNTICRYLANKNGSTRLLPASPEGRAGVEKWMDWQASELNSAWRYAFMGLVRKNPGYANAKDIEASSGRWNGLMGLLDRHLAVQGPFVTGAEFTLADIVLGLSAHRWKMSPLNHPRLAKVDAWLDRLYARDGASPYLRHDTP